MRIHHQLVLGGLLLCSLFTTACVSSRLISDTRVPEVIVDNFGGITFAGQTVELARLGRTIRAAGIKKDQEVNILAPKNLDPTLRGQIYGSMLRSGYTRTIFITERKASAYVPKSP